MLQSKFRLYFKIIEQTNLTEKLKPFTGKMEKRSQNPRIFEEAKGKTCYIAGRSVVGGQERAQFEPWNASRKPCTFCSTPWHLQDPPRMSPPGKWGAALSATKKKKQ